MGAKVLGPFQKHTFLISMFLLSKKLLKYAPKYLN